MDYQAVEQHPCQYLSWYDQERDSSVVVTKLAISLFVEPDDGYILYLDFARNFPPAKIIFTANGISRNFPTAKFSSPRK